MDRHNINIWNLLIDAMLIYCLLEMSKSMNKEYIWCLYVVFFFKICFKIMQAQKNFFIDGKWFTESRCWERDIRWYWEGGIQVDYNRKTEKIVRIRKQYSRPECLRIFRWLFFSVGNRRKSSIWARIILLRKKCSFLLCYINVVRAFVVCVIYNYNTSMNFLYLW